MRSIYYRIIFDLALLLMVVWGYWFIALPLILVALLFFPFYIEALIAGMMYDALFGMESQYGWRGYIGTICTAILSLLVYFLRSTLRK